jgi:hypothetical protein
MSMKENDFVGYVGDADLHDAHISAVYRSGSSAEIRLLAHNGRELRVCFSDVKELTADRAEGMMIYALTELRADPPYRRFAFTNWDEEDTRGLEVLAKDIKIE